MFVGHYGVSFPAKRLEPSTPLWVLFLAVQFLDILWAPFILLGIEKVRIVPGFTASNPLDLFAVNPVDLADREGVITFTASIKGNHYGLARLIYHAPLLMGRNARYKIDRVNRNSYDLTLTAGLSGYSHTFEMFPFSTKYGGVAISSEDGSGQSHTSKNKNQWIESDGSTAGKKLTVTHPTTTPPR